MIFSLTQRFRVDGETPEMRAASSIEIVASVAIGESNQRRRTDAVALVTESVQEQTRVLLLDRPPVALEQRLGGREEAQCGARVRRGGADPVADQRDRRILPALQEAVADVGVHRQVKPGLVVGLAGEAPGQEV